MLHNRWPNPWTSSPYAGIRMGRIMWLGLSIKLITSAIKTNKKYLAYPGCTDHSTVIHELMHKVGLWHEQMRYDRDKYIKIHWENIIPGNSKLYLST